MQLAAFHGDVNIVYLMLKKTDLILSFGKDNYETLKRLLKHPNSLSVAYSILEEYLNYGIPFPSFIYQHKPMLDYAEGVVNASQGLMTFAYDKQREVVSNRAILNASSAVGDDVNTLILDYADDPVEVSLKPAIEILENRSKGPKVSL